VVLKPRTWSTSTLARDSREWGASGAHGQKTPVGCARGETGQGVRLTFAHLHITTTSATRVQETGDKEPWSSATSFSHFPSGLAIGGEGQWGWGGLRPKFGRSSRKIILWLWGCFPHMTETIVDSEICTKSRNLPSKSDPLTPKLMNSY